MKKRIFILALFVLLLASCSEDVVVSTPVQSDAKADSQDVYQAVVDTHYVFQSSRDTLHVFHSDTSYIVDTAYIVDTTYISHVDSIFVVHRDEPTVDEIPVNESLIVPEGSDTLDIVYFGNSLVKGYDTFGVSATAPMYDYCSRVNRHFSALGYVVNGVRASAMAFERLSDKSARDAILDEDLYPYLNESTDIVVIQLGDNVINEELLAAFKVSFVDLLNSVKGRVSENTKILCVSSWYTYETVNQAREFIAATAAEKGNAFVDISDLSADEENRSYLGAVVYKPDVGTYSLSYDEVSELAGSLSIAFTVEGTSVISTIVPDTYSIDAENKVVSWTGHEFIVNNPEIAWHPGNLGFERIAKRIVKAIEKFLASP